MSQKLKNLQTNYTKSMANQFNPNKYIKDRQLYSNYECAICYELTDNPVRCKGPCHKSFCLKCVSLTRRQSNKCPLRCSPEFHVQTIPSVQIVFMCPFNYEKCQAILQDRKAFNNHHKICQFVPEQYRHLLHLKNLFLCNNQHKLLYNNKFVYQTIYKNKQFKRLHKQTCIGCNEEGICTSICLQCTTQTKKATYCLHCRTIPCNKYQCPLGHYFLGKGAVGIMGVEADDVCYLCGLSPALICRTVYFDKICQLQICDRCQSSLGEENPLIPLRHPIYNEQNQKNDKQIEQYRRDRQQAQKQALQRLRRDIAESDEEDEDSSEQQRRRRFWGRKKKQESSSSQEDDEESAQNIFSFLMRNMRDIQMGQIEIQNNEQNQNIGSLQQQQIGRIEIEQQVMQDQKQEFYSIESDPQMKGQGFFEDQTAQPNDNINQINPQIWYDPDE